MRLMMGPRQPSETTAPRKVSPSWARGESDGVSLRVEEGEGGDGGGEVGIADAGAVGAGGDGAGDGDVGEGGEVAEGEALRVEERREVAVAHAAADGDGVRGLVDGDGLEAVEGDLLGRAVGNRVEGVAGAEGAERRARAHGGLELRQARWGDEVVGAVGYVAGPVFAWSWGFGGGADGHAGHPWGLSYPPRMMLRKIFKTGRLGLTLRSSGRAVPPLPERVLPLPRIPGGRRETRHRPGSGMGVRYSALADVVKNRQKQEQQQVSFGNDNKKARSLYTNSYGARRGSAGFLPLSCCGRRAGPSPPGWVRTPPGGLPCLQTRRRWRGRGEG